MGNLVFVLSVFENQGISQSPSDSVAWRDLSKTKPTLVRRTTQKISDAWRSISGFFSSPRITYITHTVSKKNIYFNSTEKISSNKHIFKTRKFLFFGVLLFSANIIS